MLYKCVCIILTKITAVQNEAALIHRQCARAIFSGSYFCGDY